MASGKNLPCWLSRNDQEVVESLLDLDWIWLKDEKPEFWEDNAWEYKIGCSHGWQFWATPGEACLLVVKNGATFGYCFEGWSYPQNFEEELSKAKAVIQRVLKTQQARKPRQLSLFEVN
jgi:hypothetical protein